MTVRDLPYTFVLEPACDACDRPDTVIIGRTAEQAFSQAVHIGWRCMIGGRMYCPQCASHPLVNS